MKRIQLGQEVKIEVARADAPLVLTGRVLTKSPDHLIVTGPELSALTGKPLAVVLKYSSPLGLHHADAQVEQYLGGETVDFFVPNGLFALRQARRYVRVPKQMTVMLTVLEAAAAPHLVGERDAKATTGDLSAGGLRVRSHLPLQVGDAVQVDATFRTEAQTFSLRCRSTVRRVDPPDEAGLPCLGLEYEALGDSDRDRVASFVMRLQLESRQHEKK